MVGLVGAGAFTPGEGRGRRVAESSGREWLPGEVAAGGPLAQMLNAEQPADLQME